MQVRGRPTKGTPPQTVFVLKPSSFGDIIHALPAVARLRAAWPECKFSWLVNPEWSPLLRDNPVVDEVVVFPRAEFRGWRGSDTFLRWLRAHRLRPPPDLAVDFQGLFRTALIGRASRPRWLAGLNDAREGARWFYDERVSVPFGAPHAVERYLALSDAMIARVGRGSDDQRLATLQFPLPAGQRPTDALDLTDDFVLLHPFARGADKSLTMAQVRDLCAGLPNRQVVVVGRCAVNPTEALAPNAISFLNRTSLAELIWLMRQAKFVVSVDSGPAHLAAALGRPLVAIHSWSDPRRVGPYWPEAWVLSGGELFQMRDLRTRSMSEPTRSRGLSLPPAQVAAICRLVTSPSGSFA